MPIPKPASSETHDAFIARCASAIHEEYSAQNQAYAVCEQAWRNSKKTAEDHIIEAEAALRRIGELQTSNKERSGG